MNYKWVLSTLCCVVALDRIVDAIPRAQIMIANPIYRNGAHDIGTIYDCWQTSVKA